MGDTQNINTKDNKEFWFWGKYIIFIIGAYNLIGWILPKIKNSSLSTTTRWSLTIGVALALLTEIKLNKKWFKRIVIVILFLAVGFINYIDAEKNRVIAEEQTKKLMLIALTNGKVDLFEDKLLSNLNFGCLDKNAYVHNEHFKYGNIFYFGGAFDFAIDEYKIAIRNSTNSTNSSDYDSLQLNYDKYRSILYSNLGFAYNMRGKEDDKDMAIETLEEAKNIEPKYWAPTYQTLGRLYAEKGRFEDAHNILEIARKEWENDAITYEADLYVYIREANTYDGAEKDKKLYAGADTIETLIAVLPEEYKNLEGFKKVLEMTNNIKSQIDKGSIIDSH